MSDKYIRVLRGMAKNRALDAATAEKLLNAHVEQQDGGPGSGNFGHKGRPGKVGGSSAEGGSGGSSGPEATRSLESISSPGDLKGKTVTLHGDHGRKTIIRESKNRPGEFDVEWYNPYSTRPVTGSMNVKSFKNELKMMDPEKTEISEPVGSGRMSEPASGWPWEEQNSKQPKKEEPKTAAAVEKELDGINEEIDQIDGWFKDYRRRSQAYKYEHEQEMIENTERVEELEKKRDEYKKLLESGTLPSGEPERLPMAGRTKNQKDTDKAKQDMSRECIRKAAEWPQGSEEREAYIKWSENMTKPFDKRPTKQESEAMTKKFLGSISKKLKPYAVERYKRDLANEPQITNDLCDIADEIGTGMFGLGYRLKKASDSDDGRCRIADKIAEDMREDGLTYEQAADKLSDMVRYTQACTAENLVSNFERTKAALEKKGYKVAKVKNTWNTFNEENSYRGVNCVFVSPTGTKFELQFHTPESLVAKEVQHGWYEEERNPDTKEPRKKELQKRMYRNMSAMKAPDGIERIQQYPKK